MANAEYITSYIISVKWYSIAESELELTFEMTENVLSQLNINMCTKEQYIAKTEYNWAAQVKMPHFLYQMLNYF